MWGREISGDMYTLWGQSSCSVHSHNIIKQYMHTVAYMALKVSRILIHIEYSMSSHVPRPLCSLCITQT